MGHEYMEMKNTSAAIQAYRYPAESWAGQTHYCDYTSLFQTASRRLSVDHYSDHITMRAYYPAASWGAKTFAQNGYIHKNYQSNVLGQYFFFVSRLIFLFIKDALNWLKETFTLLEKTLINAVLLNYIYMYMNEINKCNIVLFWSLRHAIEVNKRDYRAWYGLGQTYEILKMPFYSLYTIQKSPSAEVKTSPASLARCSSASADVCLCAFQA